MTLVKNDKFNGSSIGDSRFIMRQTPRSLAPLDDLPN
jgi:hypothetical protein